MSQSEYATDLIFKKAEALEEYYPAFLHHAMHNFQSLDVMRFLGHRVPSTTGKVNGRFKAQIVTDLKQRCRLESLTGKDLQAGQVLFRRLSVNFALVLPFKDSSEAAQPRSSTPSAIKLPDIPRWSEAPPRPALR